MSASNLHAILRRCVLAFAAIGATPASANAEQCVTLADEKKRLDCYDALHGRDSPPGQDPRDFTDAATQVPAEDQSERKQEEDYELIETVEAMGDHLTGRSWFRLANGQLWAQVSPERTTLQAGDSVRIKRTPFGTYHLRRTDGGSRSTQVRRLEQ